MSARRVVVVMLSLGLSAAALVSAPSALSNDDVDGRVDCARANDARPSQHRLHIVSEGSGRLSVVGSVFSDDEDLWEWRMKHNFDISSEGRVMAKDANRSFRIERSMIDLPGTDTILFMARNTETGEVCRSEQEF